MASGVDLASHSSLTISSAIKRQTIIPCLLISSHRSRPYIHVEIILWLCSRCFYSYLLSTPLLIVIDLVSCWGSVLPPLTSGAICRTYRRGTGRGPGGPTHIRGKFWWTEVATGSKYPKSLRERISGPHSRSSASH